MYTRTSAVTALRQGRLVVRGPTNSYSLLGLFFLLLTGYLPLAVYTNSKTAVMKSRARPLAVMGVLDSGDVFQLVGRLHILYWASLEQASQAASLFSSAKIRHSALLSFKSMFYVFFELDVLSGFVYAALKSFTSSWDMALLLTTSSWHTAESLTLLRALGLPARF